MHVSHREFDYDGDRAGIEQNVTKNQVLVRPIMASLTKFELNSTSGLSAKARKQLDKSEARKRWEFNGAWPKLKCTHLYELIPIIGLTATAQNARHTRGQEKNGIQSSMTKRISNLKSPKMNSAIKFELNTISGFVQMRGKLKSVSVGRKVKNIPMPPLEFG